MNFATYVDIVARSKGSASAVVDPHREMSYQDLSRESNAVANGLRECDVKPGDRVAIFLRNSASFMTTFFGAMKVGAIPVPINLRYDHHTIAWVMRDVDPGTIVTSGEFEARFEALSVEVPLIIIDGEGGIDFGTMVADAEKEGPVSERRSDDLAALMYTSGTTGRPKAVKLTHGNFTANGWAYVRYLTMYGPDTVGLTVIPCFHVAGLNVTATPFVLVGAENVLVPTWEPENVLDTIASRGVTFGMFIPTMLLDLLTHGTEGYDLSTLEYVAVGGAPMPVEQIEPVEDALGATLLEGYGMTETTPATAVTRPDQAGEKPGSIGPPMRDVVSVRIEDPDAGEPVDAGERGELLWHGDTVTPGYWNRDRENVAAFVEREGKTWLRSGDIGTMDEDGDLFVIDRLDDMIITGGENVYPSEVEEVVGSVDGVTDVAVIGTTHDRLGEQVTAVIRTTGAVTKEEIDGACRKRLPDFSIPRRVEILDEIPRTATGKIDRPSLRDQFEQRQRTDEY